MKTPGGRRTHKIAERIRSAIAVKLLQLGDPRLSLVTVVSAAVTSDLKIAKIYWTVSGGKARIPEVEDALDGAMGAFKRTVGESLSLKRIPELRFYYDDTLDVMEETERLLKKVRDREHWGGD